jgi:hypothetical protein
MSPLRPASAGAVPTGCGGLAGDTATDFNHYTKRMTLSAVYAFDIGGVRERRKRKLLPIPAPSSTGGSKM